MRSNKVMPSMSPEEWLLANLKQELPDNHEAYLPRYAAYRKLKEWTGQDFGYDANAWEKWLKKNKKKLSLDPPSQTP
jgi:hypothetical protein